MISIIIPAYNSANYLAHTLESVLNQQYTDFEIVLIDDGSTDETRRIVEEYQKKDKRIKYFYKSNGGVSSARNLGIEKAAGEYLAFLDSDDTYEPAFLGKMHARIRQTGKLLCYCGYYHRVEGRILKAFPKNFDFQDVLKYMIEIQWISTDSWLINRQFVARHAFRFSENLTYGEDFDFFCRLIYKSEGSYTAIQEYLTNYNFRPDSLSYKGNLWYSYRFMQGSLEATKTFYKYVECNPQTHHSSYPTLLLKRLHQMYLRYLWGTLLLGKATDFRALLASYQKDKAIYDFSLFLPEKKYRIWKWVVTHRAGRILGKCFFKPYKYLQRRISIRKIR